MTCAKKYTTTVNLGLPLPNCEVYILNKYAIPVPVGVAGEIHIGGVCLARGYVNNTTLTKAKFIPNPFGPGRLYKSGDIAKRLDSGEIEYLGRSDFQVKVRGVRIELGEIEAVIAKCLGVKDVIVILREDSPGTQLLTAYVTPSTVSASAVLQHIKGTLPSYMVPQVVVPIPELPLTQNGKTDRNALPAPSKELYSQSDFTKPANNLETFVVEIWAFVLKLQPNEIGTHRNFFEIGGHSLTAMQVCSRITATTGVKIPLRILFAHSTVTAFAQYIATQYPIFTEMLILNEVNPRKLSTVIPILPRELNQSAVLASQASFAQERMWTVHNMQPKSVLYSCCGLYTVTSELDINRLRTSVNLVITRHEILRTTYAQVNGKLFQYIHSSLEVPYSVFNLQSNTQISSKQPDFESLAQQQEVKQILGRAASSPFDLEHDCMLRVTIVKVHQCKYLILLCVHHIATDGWSMEILEREMNELYEGKELPPLTTQYADFAVWQRTWLQGEVLDKQTKYWQEVLSGNLPVLQLPTDKPRPPVMSHRGATISFQISAETTQRIRKIAAGASVSLFSCLLSAFFVLLQKFSGQDDIVVGTPIANRGVHELEQIVGFFVNTLAIRADLSSNPTFAALVDQIHKTVLSAYDNQDLPFEYLVNCLRGTKSLHVSPIFQAMFTFIRESETSASGGFALSNCNELMEEVMSKFDITMGLLHSNDNNRGFTGIVEYNTDIFEHRSINRLVYGFVELLEGICHHPSATVSHYSVICDPAEKRQVLDSALSLRKGISTNEPPPMAVDQLITLQAEQYPTHTAIVCETACVTYSQLNSEAEKLALLITARLSPLARAPDMRVTVGVCMQAPEWLAVAAILASWKSNLAYVPVDPKLPAARLQYILSDAGVKLIVCTQSLVSFFSEFDSSLKFIDPTVDGMQFSFFTSIYSYQNAVIALQRCLV